VFFVAWFFFSYRMAWSETAYCVWFTQDSSLNFSRIEPYSIFGTFTLPAPPIAGDSTGKDTA